MQQATAVRGAAFNDPSDLMWDHCNARHGDKWARTQNPFNVTKYAVYHLILFGFMHVTDLTLTSMRGFALGREDDKAKALGVLTVERDIKRLVVQSTRHRQAR